ncbi:MAG: HDOD domain-containing protein [Magnetococcales bacterium]|nr:HDOD domain-containing protein [Magnetococcales bacterium]
MSKSLEQLVSATSSIVSPPDLYYRMEEKISDPTCSLDGVGEILQEDPGLTARLLRIANSPFYGFTHPVTTITRALATIGVKQLRDLVLASSMVNMFKEAPSDLIDLDAFWRHSVTCGLVARTVAVFRKENNVESFYVTGLLHDLGRLVLLQMEPEAFRESMKHANNCGMLLYEAEREIMGFNHAELGGALLRHWNLPTGLYLPIACHHMPDEGVEYPIESAIIHLSDVIAHAMAIGASGEVFIPPLSPEAWDLIGFPANEIRLVVQQVDRQFEDAIQMFEGEEAQGAA